MKAASFRELEAGHRQVHSLDSQGPSNLRAGGLRGVEARILPAYPQNSENMSFQSRLHWAAPKQTMKDS